MRDYLQQELLLYGPLARWFQRWAIAQGRCPCRGIQWSPLGIAVRLDGATWQGAARQPIGAGADTAVAEPTNFSSAAVMEHAAVVMLASVLGARRRVD